MPRQIPRGTAAKWRQSPPRWPDESGHPASRRHKCPQASHHPANGHPRSVETTDGGPTVGQEPQNVLGDEVSWPHSD